MNANGVFMVDVFLNSHKNKCLESKKFKMVDFWWT